MIMKPLGYGKIETLAVTEKGRLVRESLNTPDYDIIRTKWLFKNKALK